jgi:hypothetical protein
MISPGAFNSMQRLNPAYSSVLSTVSASSNVPAQGILDMIWLMEGNICTYSEKSDATSKEKIWKIIRKYTEPLFPPDQAIGEFWDSLNFADKADLNLLKWWDNFGDLADNSATEGFQTPSPLVMEIAWFLPPPGLLGSPGFQADSATTDDGGLITAIKAIDQMDEQFRPTELLALLTTHDTWHIQRHFAPTCSMASTFTPLIERIDPEGGMDCSFAKNTMVANPYHIFEANVGASTIIDMENVPVLKNVYFDVKGNFTVNLRIFSLTLTDADVHYLEFLPPDWVPKLMSYGFPAFDRQTASGFFAVDFLKGWNLFGASAYRGYLLVCQLVTMDRHGHKLELDFGAHLVNHCQEKEILDLIFHDEHVLTALLTVTPGPLNTPFEHLRTNVQQNMAGYSYWGLESMEAAQFAGRHDNWLAHHAS